MLFIPRFATVLMEILTILPCLLDFETEHRLSRPSDVNETDIDLANKVEVECHMFFNKEGGIKMESLIEKHIEMDKNGDGAIDFQEFYNWETSNFDVYRGDVEKNLFYKYDENSDKKVTFTEFIDALQEMDTDNDGEITHNECVQSETKIYNVTLNESKSNSIAEI